MPDFANQRHGSAAAIAWVILWLLVQVSVTIDCTHGQALHTDRAVHQPAKLAGMTEGSWQFELTGEPIEVAQDLMRWGTYPGIIRSQAVWASDGSWLCGEIEVGTDEISVTSDWFESYSLPLSGARAIVLSSPATLEQWLELESQLAGTTGTEDHVWLRDGNHLSGVLDISKESLAGNSLALDTGGQEVNLSLEQIAAILFSPALQTPLDSKSTAERIGMRDGSMLAAVSRSIVDQRIIIALAGGMRLTSFDEPSEFVKAIVSIEHTPTNIVRLSDLEPASYKHVSDNSLKWPLGVNRDVYGRPLMLDAGVVTNGLAMHSASQVAYRWDGSPARLIAELCFATTQPGGNRQLGSVDCRLLVARGGRLEEVAAVSLNRSAGDAPDSAMVNVDVSDAQLIVLIVEPADFGQFGDHVLWLDARLFSEPR